MGTLDELQKLIPVIRQTLSLDEGVMKSIPDDLIMLAFIPRDYDLPFEVARELLRKYGYKNYEFFEFWGDQVLGLIVVQALYERKEVSELSVYHNLKVILTGNSILNCLMTNKQLCKDKDFYTKTCADQFEAILGSIYWYLYYKLDYKDAFEIIFQWYKKTWDFDTIISALQGRGSHPCVRPLESPKKVIYSHKFKAPKLIYRPVEHQSPTEEFSQF